MGFRRRAWIHAALLASLLGMGACGAKGAWPSSFPAEATLDHDAPAFELDPPHKMTRYLPKGATLTVLEKLPSGAFLVRFTPRRGSERELLCLGGDLGLPGAEAKAAPDSSDDSFVVLSEAVAVYGSRPPHMVKRFFPAGSRLEIREASGSGFVRVRKYREDGSVLEAMCMAEDLAHPKMPSLRVSMAEIGPEPEPVAAPVPAAPAEPEVQKEEPPDDSGPVDDSLIESAAEPAVASGTDEPAASSMVSVGGIGFYSTRPPHALVQRLPEDAYLEVVGGGWGGFERVRYHAPDGKVVEGLCLAGDLTPVHGEEEPEEPVEAAAEQPSTDEPNPGAFDIQSWIAKREAARAVTGEDANGEEEGAPRAPAAKHPLPARIAVYSSKPPHPLRGYFSKGGEILILAEAEDDFARVRLFQPDGPVREAFCKIDDLAALKVPLPESMAPEPILPGRGSGAYEERKWLEDYAGHKQALSLQRKHKVPLMLYFYADWNEHCDALEKQLFKKFAFKRLVKGVIKVKINPEHGKEEGRLAAKYNVHGYPTVLVIDKPGKKPRKVILRTHRWGQPKVDPPKTAHAKIMGTWEAMQKKKAEEAKKKAEEEKKKAEGKKEPGEKEKAEGAAEAKGQWPEEKPGERDWPGTE